MIAMGAAGMVGSRTFLDFFAGVGMAELGLAPDWQCVWANDIDSRKAAIHALNLPHTIYRIGDVAEVPVDDLPAPTAMAWASFPCQDLSLAGWRRGMTSNRSGTFWAFWNLMDALHKRRMRPPLIVIENVPGLLYGSDLTGLLEALAALDMQFGALLIDAERFVPQSRPRVFIVAADAALHVSRFIEPRPEQCIWFDKRVWSAWRALPASLQARWRWWRLPVPKCARPTIESIILHDADDVRWQSAAETDYLLSLMSEPNLKKVQDAIQQPVRQVGFLYRRTRAAGQRAEVRFDGVAGCLRTPTGGSSRQTVVVVENGQVRSRLLDPREAARLMGLPDWFQLPDRYNEAYYAMGDGVVVPVVDWLGQHLLTPLADLATRPFTAALPLDDIQSFRAAAETHAERWARAKA
jgi:DNA (cytosine-5)-methyltransferase 1